MIFQTECTLPPDEPGIVASPDMRGTLDIVWSCLAVVLLCTWVVLHENVPAEGSTDGPWWTWPRLFLSAYLAVQKACSFVYALFAPELFTGKAMMCLYFAHHVKDLMEDRAKEDMVEWSIYHAFLANMGGFAIEFTEETESSSEPRSETSNTAQDKMEGVLADVEKQSPDTDSSGSPSAPSLFPSKQDPRELGIQQTSRRFASPCS